jgi:hypothetical protein
MNDTPNEDEDAKTKGSTSEEDEEEVYEVF